LRSSTSHWSLQALVCLSAAHQCGHCAQGNGIRCAIEMKLEEQKRLLLEARLDALQRQIIRISL